MDKARTFSAFRRLAHGPHKYAEGDKEQDAAVDEPWAPSCCWRGPEVDERQGREEAEDEADDQQGGANPEDDGLLRGLLDVEKESSGQREQANGGLLLSVEFL